MQLEFFTARQFTTANPANIRRLRWVPGDGAHGDPVACAVLSDGTVGRFLDTDALIDYLQH